MKAPLITIDGFTSKNREEMVARVQKAVELSGGSVSSLKPYSNSALNIQVETKGLNMDTLYNALKETELILEDCACRKLQNAAPAANQPSVVCINLTFIHCSKPAGN